jgi:hypothetical protein
LRIVFTKDKQGGEAHSLRVERENGTSDWMPTTPFFVEHDITHFAVETTLGFQEAFWGLMSKGWSFSNFEDRQPGSRKAVQLPPEAYITEGLVGAIQVDHMHGPFSYEGFLKVLRESHEALGATPPVITSEQLTSIRELKNQLIVRWKELAPGDRLEITFGTP